MSCRTGAHWPVSPRSVKSCLALSSRSAWVGCAEVLLFKWSAAYERVPSVTSWARAHCFVISGLTCGSLSTHVRVGVVTRVSALELDTSLVRGTVIVSRALGVATGERISKEVWRTGALCAMVDSLTVGIFPACSTSTGRLTAVVLAITCLRLSTLVVRVTFMATSLQRISNVCWLTATDWTVILPNLTVSIGSTRSTNLIPGKPPAVPERVPCGAPGTPAYSHMVLDGAVSPLST